jgi:hypothetical protein
VATVAALNATQLATETVLIESPALDLTDQVYEDRLPADILNSLIALGDNQTPPRQWGVGASGKDSDCICGPVAARAVRGMWTRPD